MAKRTTTRAPAVPETEPAKKRLAATGVTAKTATARKTVATTKRPPPTSSRAKTPVRKQPGAADAPPTPRRARATPPLPEAPAEPRGASAVDSAFDEAPVTESEIDESPEQPFAEGAHDTIDPDLRHRMISETAYHLYRDRGYEDGYDLDDWLQAEAEVDHLLLGRPRR